MRNFGNLFRPAVDYGKPRSLVAQCNYGIDG